MFKILKHKTIEGLYGVIEKDGSIHVTHKPDLYFEGQSLEGLKKELDPHIPDPLGDWEYWTISFNYLKKE